MPYGNFANPGPPIHWYGAYIKHLSITENFNAGTTLRKLGFHQKGTKFLLKSLPIRSLIKGSCPA